MTAAAPSAPGGQVRAATEHLARAAHLVDPILDAVIPPAETSPSDLHRAMRHLVFPGGKRLRPALALSACEAVGGDPVAALHAAAAVELLHVYSLIHDDLPCMDDDVLRRGRPSVHVAFGEATALLAGDALQALAFQVLAEAPAPAEPVVGAMRELAAAAGSLHLVGGQVEDLAFVPGREDEAERVEAIHRRKSAALVAAAVSMGARFGGAEEAWRCELHGFGLELGVAFQIADDLLDAKEADEPCSLARVLGPAKAGLRAEELLERALDRISGLDERAQGLRALARFAVRRDR